MHSTIYFEHEHLRLLRLDAAPQPRFAEAADRFYVCVGNWLHQVDAEKLHELIEDEFNLPIDFEFVEDYHWDLGHGWSEELL